jgi:hypothetical protein
MKIAICIIKQYTIGVVTASLLIGIIHFYSLIFESYFSYATWENIIQTALFSGFPFGIASWAFTNLKTTK